MRTIVVACIALVPLTATAAPVAGWIVVNPSTGAATTKPLAGANSSSPILGNGAEDSAATVAMYADISGIRDGSLDVSLANGQRVTLTGSASFSGIVSSLEQFRWGLFQESAAPFDAIAWQGFIASNSAGSSGGALRAKPVEFTTFAQTGSASNLRTAQDGGPFVDGAYHFSMSVARFNDHAILDASLTSDNGWSQHWTSVELPTFFAAEQFDFNRVGFLSGGGMHANRISFSNIDVTVAPVDALQLQVFTAGPNAGTVRIRNNRSQNFEIEYYEITSDAGSLSDNFWTSLDAQEGADDEFEGWEEAAGNGQGLLSEYRLNSTLNVAPASTLSLGKAFDVGSAEDLKFFVGLSDGTLVRGVVEYVSDGQTGDFTGDGAVNAADYTLWRKKLGTSHIDPDYALWQENFGAIEGGSGQAAVPEPTTLLLAMLILCGFATSRCD